MADTALHNIDENAPSVSLQVGKQITDVSVGCGKD